jgi:hypothetical protein
MKQGLTKYRVIVAKKATAFPAFDLASFIITKDSDVLITEKLLLEETKERGFNSSFVWSVIIDQSKKEIKDETKEEVM